MGEPVSAAAGIAATATGAAGVSLYPQQFEDVVAELRAAVGNAAGVPPHRRFTAPPVIAEAVVDRADYPATFPQLLGAVHGLRNGPDGSAAPTDLVLPPAACHHIYPLLAGHAITEPVDHVIHGTCFRLEASDEPGRFRSFRMSEIVRVGAPDLIGWRDGWARAAAAWLSELGLQAKVEVAADPFFGPGERYLRATQREQQLKLECLVEVADGLHQAVASANYHKDHFGVAFDMTWRGAPAHSACAAFGLERIVLALVHRHGPDRERWPQRLRRSLPKLGDPRPNDEVE